MKLNGITWITLTLVVVGALNWGLVGLFDFDLVAAIFGQMSRISRVVYVLVSISGVFLFISAIKSKK